MVWDKYDSIRFEESEYAYSRAAQAYKDERRNPKPVLSEQDRIRAMKARDEEVRSMVNCGPWGDAE